MKLRTFYSSMSTTGTRGSYSRSSISSAEWPDISDWPSVEDDPSVTTTDLIIPGAGTRSSSYSFPTNTSMDVSTMTNDTGYDHPIGPSWRVPKAQYNLLRKHILSKKRKGAPKKKTTTRKRPYTRRRTYRRAGSSTLGGMGPIVITGRGGYFTDKFKAGASAAYRGFQRALPSGTFERLGRAAGGAMFGASGAAMGGMAGRGIASLSGFGAYTIRKNDILQLDEGMQVASFGDMNHGVVIMHREYIADVTPSEIFNLKSYPINPGLSQTFPWLSQIAPNFDQYQILGMVFHFKSTASEFGAANLALGTIIMASDYDSADTNYFNKLEMENAQYSTSAKPSVDCIHAIECDPSITFAPIKYVRDSAVPANKDIRLYDHANFQLATIGQPFSTGTIGELWVTYKIAFFKPQLTLGRALQTDFYASATATNTSRWGSNAVPIAGSSVGTNVVNNTLFFPGLTSNPVQVSRQGHWYLIDWYCAGGQVTLSTPPAISGTDCTATILNGSTNGGGAVSNVALLTAKVLITGNSPSVTITAVTLPSSPVLCNFTVTQIDTDVAPNIV